MAHNEHTNPDAETKKWFAITVIAVTLYVTAAFTFVITAHIEPDTTRPEVQYGQHN